MTITKEQLLLIKKVKSPGTGNLAIQLTDEMCCYIIGLVVKDFGLEAEFPEIDKSIPPFFSNTSPEKLVINNISFISLFQKLIKINENLDVYFYCLSSLYKTKIKLHNIIKNQPIPNINQINLKSLLYHGFINPNSLTTFLKWSKWIYDIDNRVAQETGYLFEPIIRSVIGGIKVNAHNSPIRRYNNPQKGRQIDCLVGNKAYEIKIRLTAAASGQGRWGEELSFPYDCYKSGYEPILLVLDPTYNPKLNQIITTFEKNGGLCYIGDDAWNHLEHIANDTMNMFLNKYIKTPIENMKIIDTCQIPDITFSMVPSEFKIMTKEQSYSFPRATKSKQELLADELLGFN
jgi:hypothetical protein